MNIIIVGAGSVGRHLCEMLITEGHDVTVIEKDENKCEQLLSKVDVQIIKGNATTPDILKEAKLDKCDIFITTSERDEVNLIACMYAKNQGVERVISMVSKGEYAKMLYGLGIETIRQDISTAREIDLKIIKPTVAKLVLPGVGDIEILEIEITKKSPFIGKNLDSIPTKEDFKPIVVHKKDRFVLNSDGYALEEGDIVIVICRPKSIKHVLKIFKPDNMLVKILKKSRILRS